MHPGLTDGDDLWPACYAGCCNISIYKKYPECLNGTCEFENCCLILLKQTFEVAAPTPRTP